MVSGGPGDRPLRVGLVCPYDLDVPGGVREQVLGLARALSAAGDQVQVLAPRGRGAPSFAQVDGVRVVTAGGAVGLPTNGSTARLALDPVARRRAARWARSGFDVVHVHEPIPPGIGHSVLRRLAAERDAGLPGPAVVATVHVSMSPRPAGRSRSLRSAARHVGGLLRHVDVLTAVSEHARRTLVDHLGRVPVVVPNGLDVASWPVPRARGPRGAGVAPTVVVLGRAGEPRKGVDVVLRAWPRVREAHPTARLLVVGPSAGMTVAPGRGIQLVGTVDEDTKRRLLAQADALLAPHRGGESFGIVLVEALAAGAPVVASDLPAFRAVLAGHGTLVPPGDAPALAAAVVAVLDGGGAHDPAPGRARAETFDWAVVARRWRRLHATALRVRAGPEALAAELDDALAERARIALSLATAPDPDPDRDARSGQWRQWLREAAGRATAVRDTQAQSGLTALLRAGVLPPGPAHELTEATARVRDVRGLVNEVARRHGHPTVELDDDTTPSGPVGTGRQDALP